MVTLDEKNMPRHTDALQSLLGTVFKVECFHLPDDIQHNYVPLRALLLLKYFYYFFPVMASNP